MRANHFRLTEDNMPSWKSKICRGMDVVESITFTRQDVDAEGTLRFVSAAHVPSEQKMREEWTQEEIDLIGERIAPNLDAELARQIASPPKVLAFPEPENAVQVESEAEAEPVVEADAQHKVAEPVADESE